MLNNEIIISRLALIKQLFKNGLEQSKLSEPFSTFSILSFHDSIEMFLKLLSEHKSIKTDKFNFLDYWEAIPTLTLKESMSALNKRRVNIKHYGLLPSKSDIEISRVNSIDFFEQNTYLHFQVNFKDISLLTLVKFDSVKKYLIAAQNSIASNNFNESIENSAFAFNELIHSYEINKTQYSDKSPFFFGKDFTFENSFSIGIKDQKLAKFIDKLKESIESIRSAIKILSFGIDYKKYVKFNLLTPRVRRYNDARLESFEPSFIGKKLGITNCQYCIDFVIESALKLQEFDFDIEEIEESRWTRNGSLKDIFYPQPGDKS